MFTGIVQELGAVIGCEAHVAGARLTIGCSAVLVDAQLGASIAVNGTCLTAVQLTAESFSADVAPETLRRTNLGDLRKGAQVNLERPLAVTARLDGHFVLGHVDGTAELVSIEPLGDDNWWLRIRVPDDLKRYIVSKGSLAVDGISLTVAAIDGALVEFTVVPHTFRHTTLGGYRAGARLNVEVDILAKHLEKLTACG